MTRKTGVAIIGLGPASQPHSRSLADLADRVDVRWAVSRSAERTNAYSEQFPFPTTNDMDAAIRDPSVDAVIVLTPPSSHLDVAEQCLAAGKHVLVEKPLELTVPRAEQLVQLASASGCRFGVVLQHRFRPASVRLKRALDGGELGRCAGGLPCGALVAPAKLLRRARTRNLGAGRRRRPADASNSLARPLPLPRRRVSEVIRSDVRTTDLHRMETEDLVTAILRFGNGAAGTLMATTAAYPGYPERIEIIGTKGIRVIDRRDTADIVPRRPARSSVESEGKTGSGASIMDFPHDSHRALIADFLDAIRGQPRAPGFRRGGACQSAARRRHPRSWRTLRERWLDATLGQNFGDVS